MKKWKNALFGSFWKRAHGNRSKRNHNVFDIHIYWERKKMEDEKNAIIWHNVNDKTKQKNEKKIGSGRMSLTINQCITPKRLKSAFFGHSHLQWNWMWNCVTVTNYYRYYSTLVLSMFEHSIDFPITSPEHKANWTKKKTTN